MERFAYLLAALRRYGSRSCIEDGEQTYTYEQLLEQVECWRQRFIEQNVAPGCVVGLRADYSAAALAALLALNAHRACVALIPRDRDPAGYLADACAAVALDVDIDGRFTWSQLADPATHSLLERLRATGEAGIVIFTSGSSGRPKAALHGVERFLYKFRRPGRSLRTLAFLLLDHIAGLDTVFYTLANGGTLILTRQRDPKSIGRLIESHRVEVLPASPSFLRLMCASKDERHDLSSLKVITFGSELMDATTLNRLSARFPDAQISQKYGTTETGSPRTVTRAGDGLWVKLKDDSVESKIVDGILWIRSESTILGYLNAPSPLDAEGWYCTGDLVDRDGEWIRFRGRASDSFKVGGEKVSPAEVEQAILQLSFVREAVVFGEPHPLMGHVAAAQVTLAEPMEAKQAAQLIRAHCRQRLASFKVPLGVEICGYQLTSERQKARRRAKESPTT